MSKTPAPKKAPTKRRTPTTATPDPIDHHALALLEYIDSGGHGGIDAVRQARAILRGVAADLVSADPEADPSVMHGSMKSPGIFSTIFEATLNGYRRQEDSTAHVQFMTELEGDKAADLPPTSAQVAFDVLVATITDAAVLGAAVAIEMMRERAR